MCSVNIIFHVAQLENRDMVPFEHVKTPREPVFAYTCLSNECMTSSDFAEEGADLAGNEVSVHYN